jgi:acetate---CoA ligase (ADP-forming)
LKKFLEPQSVAIIGASADPMKGGHALVSNLKHKFQERLYPVNPRLSRVHGLPCFRSVLELPEPPDLAVVFVSASIVPEVLEQCGVRGIDRVMIQSAGFAETGEQGLRLQARCAEIAKRSGIRLWGPNCMGAINGHSGMVASFLRPEVWEGHLREGDVSLIVQSGMLSAGFLVQVMREGAFGLSKACSIGNRADVNECDLLEYFQKDPDTAVVAMYLESVADVPRFRRAVQALRKPVVLLKGGITPQGAGVARSHTASLAQDGALAEGFFRQLGIHRAYDFPEMVDFTRALSLWKEKKGGPRIGVITFSGASGTVATDHIIQEGMSLSDLSGKSLTALAGVLPPWAVVQNPVDLWPAVERVGRGKAYGTALQAMAEDPGVDAIYVHTYVDSTILREILEAVAPLQSLQKPLALWVIGDPPSFRPLRDRVEPMGVPVFTELGRGVKALGLMARSPR